MRVTIHEHGTTIVLPCGLVVEGRPQDTEAYRATAAALGYGEGPDAALAMCRAHDALHARLCAWLGIPESYSLRQAAGLPVDAELAAIEEDAVMVVQRLMVLGGGRMPGGADGLDSNGRPDPYKGTALPD